MSIAIAEGRAEALLLLPAGQEGNATLPTAAQSAMPVPHQPRCPHPRTPGSRRRCARPGSAPPPPPGSGCRWQTWRRGWRPRPSGCAPRRCTSCRPPGRVRWRGQGDGEGGWGADVQVMQAAQGRLSLCACQPVRQPVAHAQSSDPPDSTLHPQARPCTLSSRRRGLVRTPVALYTPVTVMRSPGLARSTRSCGGEGGGEGEGNQVRGRVGEGNT